LLLNFEKYLLSRSVIKHKISNDNAKSLKEYSGVWRVITIVYRQHVNIDKGSNLSQEVFKPSKKWRIVDSPFRMVSWIPLRYWQTVRRGQPVAMHLEIGRKTVENRMRQEFSDRDCGYCREKDETAVKTSDTDKQMTIPEIGGPSLTRTATGATSSTLWRRAWNP